MGRFVPIRGLIARGRSDRPSLRRQVSLIEEMVRVSFVPETGSHPKPTAGQAFSEMRVDCNALFCCIMMSVFC